MDTADIIAAIEAIDSLEELDKLSVPIWNRRTWLVGETVEARRIAAIMDASAAWEEGQRVRITSGYRTLNQKIGTIKKIVYPERGQLQVRLAVRLDTGPRKAPRYYVDTDGNVIAFPDKSPYGDPWAEAI